MFLNDENLMDFVGYFLFVNRFYNFIQCVYDKVMYVVDRISVSFLNFLYKVFVVWEMIRIQIRK